MKKSILLIDNNDSFTYNLVQMLTEHGADVEVVNIDDANAKLCAGFDKIMLSPGPELPLNYPNMMNIIDECHTACDILGVCLGHQAIGSYFGMGLKQLSFPKHGVQSRVIITHNDIIYKGITNEFYAGRYHSWVLDENPLNKSLIITSNDDNGDIMSIMHVRYKVRGLQFHPESIMTDKGYVILNNWINYS
jgi:anthranilate synthase component II